MEAAKLLFYCIVRPEDTFSHEKARAQNCDMLIVLFTFGGYTELQRA